MMDSYPVLALVLFCFVLAVGSLSLLRREPASFAYIGEILVWGALLLGVAWALRLPSPLLYLVALYLITMRSRLLVDAANGLAARQQPAAFHLYTLAARLAWNPADRAIVLANQGAAFLSSGQVAEAVARLEKVLAAPRLGLKLEAATRCNLGLAYLRLGEIARGRAELDEAVALMPGSAYARRARVALQQLDARRAEPA